MLPLRLVVCLFLLLLLQHAESHDYDVYLDERELMKDCDAQDNKGNLSLDELLEAHISTDMDNDYETLLVSGNITAKTEWPQGSIALESEVYRWQRGQWVSSGLYLKRDNLCTALFNPFELWHLYIMTNVPKEYRVCPPEPGYVFRFHNMSSHMQVLGMPYWNLEGKIKVIIHVTIGDKITCLAIYGKIDVN